MSEFWVGQKVVCVDTSWNGTGSEKTCPLGKNSIYIIRWVDNYRKTEGTVFHGIRVEGIFREEVGVWLDTPFRSSRFRPLESRAISIFRAIAANPHIEIEDDDLERVGDGRGVT